MGFFRFANHDVGRILAFARARTKEKRGGGTRGGRAPYQLDQSSWTVQEFAVAPRAYWKGYLKLSLVSCPIALFPASTEREKIAFHQLNKKTGNRIKYRKVDAETGEEVDAGDIIKGYEVGKGEYIELEPEELDAVAIESKRIIDIDQFVPRKEIDELYLNNPYYIVPDGEAGQQAFAVIREAIRKEGMVALAKVVFTSREHVIALEARDKGMLGITLRYPYEVRKEADYFDDIPDEKIPKDMLELGTHIVETKAGHFHPETFEDRYEDALAQEEAARREDRAPEGARAVEGDQSDGRAAPQRRNGRAATSGAHRGCPRAGAEKRTAVRRPPQALSLAECVVWRIRQRDSRAGRAKTPPTVSRSRAASHIAPA
jgi:DNA end-binding protein Ku